MLLERWCFSTPSLFLQILVAQNQDFIGRTVKKVEINNEMVANISIVGHVQKKRQILVSSNNVDLELQHVLKLCT